MFTYRISTESMELLSVTNSESVKFYKSQIENKIAEVVLCLNDGKVYKLNPLVDTYISNFCLDDTDDDKVNGLIEVLLELKLGFTSLLRVMESEEVLFTAKGTDQESQKSLELYLYIDELTPYIEKASGHLQYLKKWISI